MTKMIPIAITILQCGGQFVFLKRRNPPYEQLWSLVGGKIGIGEHVPTAAKREVLEETGATIISEYVLKGIVSERLIRPTGELVAHFLIFVGGANITTFNENHREGELALFSIDSLEARKQEVLPSDYQMFSRFVGSASGLISYHEAEMIQDNGKYKLSYYREVTR